MNKDLSQSQARKRWHLKALPVLGKMRFEGMDLERAGVKAQGVQKPLEQKLKAGRGHRIKPVRRPEIKVREGPILVGIHSVYREDCTDMELCEGSLAKGVEWLSWQTDQ